MDEHTRNGHAASRNSSSNQPISSASVSPSGREHADAPADPLNGAASIKLPGFAPGVGVIHRRGAPFASRPCVACPEEQESGYYVHAGGAVDLYLCGRHAERLVETHRDAAASVGEVAP